MPICDCGSPDTITINDALNRANIALNRSNEAIRIATEANPMPDLSCKIIEIQPPDGKVSYWRYGALVFVRISYMKMHSGTSNSYGGFRLPRIAKKTVATYPNPNTEILFAPESGQLENANDSSDIILNSEMTIINDPDDPDKGAVLYCNNHGNLTDIYVTGDYFYLSDGPDYDLPILVD